MRAQPGSLMRYEEYSAENAAAKEAATVGKHGDRVQAYVVYFAATLRGQADACGHRGGVRPTDGRTRGALRVLVTPNYSIGPKIALKIGPNGTLTGKLACKAAVVSSSGASAPPRVRALIRGSRRSSTPLLAVMSELHTIRNRYNAIVSAGNDINSSLSSFSWGKSYDSVNNVARQIDGLQRAIAALAEVRHLHVRATSVLPCAFPTNPCFWMSSCFPLLLRSPDEADASM